MNLNMANSSEANGMMQETAANGSEATGALDPSMREDAQATDILTEDMLQEGGMGSHGYPGSVHDRQPGTGKTACIYTGTRRNHGSGSKHVAAFQQYL